jgi:hypothetical protein
MSTELTLEDIKGASYEDILALLNLRANIINVLEERIRGLNEIINKEEEQIKHLQELLK